VRTDSTTRDSLTITTRTEVGEDVGGCVEVCVGGESVGGYLHDEVKQGLDVSKIHGLSHKISFPARELKKKNLRQS